MKMKHSDSGGHSHRHHAGLDTAVDDDGGLDMIYGDLGDSFYSSTTTMDPDSASANVEERSRNSFFVTNGDNDNLFYENGVLPSPATNKSSWPIANTNSTAVPRTITRNSDPEQPIGNMWDSFSSWFTSQDEDPSGAAGAAPSFYSSSSLSADVPGAGADPRPIPLASSFFFNETHYRFESNNYEQVFGFIDDDSAAAAANSAGATLFEYDSFGSGLGWNDSLGFNCSWNETCPDGGLVHAHNYWALILVLFPLFTVLGNVLVILSVKRERTLQNITNFFIVSLAVADLLVAIAVMPFGVYVLVNEQVWELPPSLCDFYFAMDVTCSTSSILNLVAISIDRFIAVTQPIKYAKHKSTTRVWLTIVFVWAFSGLVGSPIVLGLNAPPEGEEVENVCAFHNKYFSLFSSLCSFYIPCAILIFLYYRIFKVIRERAARAQGARHKNATPLGGGAGRGGNTGGGTVIENLAHTKRLAETALGGPPIGGGGGGGAPNHGGALIISNKSNATTGTGVEDEKLTNTQSASQEEGELEDLERDDGDGDDGSPDSDECHIIPNNQVTTAFVMQTVMRDEERPIIRRGGSLVIEPNGNHDSGYAASNLEESPHPVQDSVSQLSPTKHEHDPHSLGVPDQCKRNGLPQSGGENGDRDRTGGGSSPNSPNRDPGGDSGSRDERSGSNLLDVTTGGGSGTGFGEEASTSSARLRQAAGGNGGGGAGPGGGPAARFTICKVHKASRKKREKSSAKRERKATKTLAIVLGLFLACWLPFFTANILDAICSLRGLDCSPGLTTFLLTTWLGYINSSLNPIVYTIFNTEFRKAFKKILGMGP